MEQAGWIFVREAEKLNPGFPRNKSSQRSVGEAVGSFSNDDGHGHGKQDVKKAIGLMSKTTTLLVHHAFVYISLLSLHNYDVK